MNLADETDGVSEVVVAIPAVVFERIALETDEDESVTEWLSDVENLNLTPLEECPFCGSAAPGSGDEE